MLFFFFKFVLIFCILLYCTKVKKNIFTCGQYNNEVLVERSGIFLLKVS